MKTLSLCITAILLLSTVMAKPATVSILSPGVTNSIFHFAVQTEANFNTGYVAEYKESLEDATWTPFRSFIGDGTIVEVSDPVQGRRQRFFRVRVVII